MKNQVTSDIGCERSYPGVNECLASIVESTLFFFVIDVGGVNGW